MKINRLICIIAIIGSGIFASYFGGNVSYALFYLSLLVPIVAFLYTLYVYYRFKVYQTIDSYTVVKGDWNDYSFIIANEDYITFQSIKVRFFRDKSTIDETDQIVEYSLIPGEREKHEGKIRCNYRGEYYVGIESVEVTDFLNLFPITYPLLTKMKVTVLPRVINIEKLSMAPSETDVKNPINYSDKVEEELDTEVRKYLPGDNKKRVHWKASAKLGELVSRKYYYKTKHEIQLYMDLVKVEETELETIIIEDKIIESILGIANYYMKNETPSHINYDYMGLKTLSISSKDEFEAFYNICATIKFNATTDISNIIKEQLYRKEEGLFIVVATHLLTKELYLVAQDALSKGNYFGIIFINDDLSEETKKMISDLRGAGAYVYQFMRDDDIIDMLSA